MDLTLLLLLLDVRFHCVSYVLNVTLRRREILLRVIFRRDDETRFELPWNPLLPQEEGDSLAGGVRSLPYLAWLEGSSLGLLLHGTAPREICSRIRTRANQSRRNDLYSIYICPNSEGFKRRMTQNIAASVQLSWERLAFGTLTF